MSTTSADVAPTPGQRDGRVNIIRTDAPWDWMSAGWNDLWQSPAISLGYGLVFAIGAFVILMGLTEAASAAIILVLAGGFLLVAPLFAVGLYEKSRRLAAGEPISAGPVAFVKTQSPMSLAYFGVVLMIAYLVWVRIAMLLFALFFGRLGFPPLEEFVPNLLFTSSGLGLLVVGTIVGAAIAGSIFAMSAVSVPMMMERRVDVITAVSTSIEAVRKNQGAMLLWALIIAVTMIAGMAAAFVGLAVAFPLIAHATWHAYKDLVPADD